MDLSAIGSLLPSVFQGGMGIFQSILGAMNKPQRPVYKVPDSVRKATDNAENLASGDMPGLATQKAMVDLQGGQALNTLKEGLGGSPALVGSVADILGKQNAAKNELAVQNANFKSGAQQNLQGQLNLEGQYEDKKQGDALLDYSQKSSANSALTQAGLNNIFNMFQNTAGVASYNSLSKSLMGDKVGSPQVSGPTAQPQGVPLPTDFLNKLKGFNLSSII